MLATLTNKIEFASGGFNVVCNQALVSGCRYIRLDPNNLVDTASLACPADELTSVSYKRVAWFSNLLQKISSLPAAAACDRGSSEAR